MAVPSSEASAQPLGSAGSSDPAARSRVWLAHESGTHHRGSRSTTGRGGGRVPVEAPSIRARRRHGRALGPRTEGGRVHRRLAVSRRARRPAGGIGRNGARPPVSDRDQRAVHGHPSRPRAGEEIGQAPRRALSRCSLRPPVRRDHLAQARPGSPHLAAGGADQGHRPPLVRGLARTGPGAPAPTPRRLASEVSRSTSAEVRRARACSNTGSTAPARKASSSGGETSPTPSTVLCCSGRGEARASAGRHPSRTSATPCRMGERSERRARGAARTSDCRSTAGCCTPIRGGPRLSSNSSRRSRTASMRSTPPRTSPATSSSDGASGTTARWRGSRHPPVTSKVCRLHRCGCPGSDASTRLP